MPHHAAYKLVPACLTLACLAIVQPAPAKAGGTVTVAMTAGDIPLTTGQPDQGAEGFRFVGWNLYDALINWDLSKSDGPSDIKPGLATSWKIDPNNPKRWIFTLREGVKFHDGCSFGADDVVWNLDRLNDRTKPQYFTQQFALSRTYMSLYEGVEKIDDRTVAINTKVVASMFPYDMAYVVMISRCRAEALKYDWNAYAFAPSGTGPYKYASMVAHERLELVQNPDYWDKARIPKNDRLVLLPMPEASTRTAALLNGQVNFIEAPSPDSIPRLKSAGMQIVTNTYPHNWVYNLNYERGPFTDIRIRRAANHAINRADVVELLGGYAIEGYAQVPPSLPYYGKPVRYEFDPKKARALLKEANCLPCKVRFAISTSGSGQMQVLPMNELVKSQLEEAGFQVTFDVMDWNSLLEISRSGIPKYPDLPGYNVSRLLQDPITAIVKPVGRNYWSPAGSNWGHWQDPVTDKLVDDIFNEFDADKRMKLLTRLHEYENEQAMMIYVVHDVNPRALSPKLKGFVQAQSWYQDLTAISVVP
eukprot:gene12541-12630_t